MNGLCLNDPDIGIDVAENPDRSWTARLAGGRHARYAGTGKTPQHAIGALFAALAEAGIVTLFVRTRRGSWESWPSRS